MKLCSSNAPIVKHQKTMRSSTHVSGSRFHGLLTQVCSAVVAIILPAYALAQNAGVDVCTRAVTGSEVSAPQEIRSQNGVLQVALSLRESVQPTADVRYCYVDEKGNQAPTLRLSPGDLLIVKLKNELPNASTAMPTPAHAIRLPCASDQMEAASTNLHFHGLMIPPTCHQDDVLNTTIQPGAPAYEYRIRIQRTQPPGLYWYHPHPHGHSEEQVLGGASGALIVEGIERFNRLVAGLPERLLVIRDQARLSDNVVGGTKPPSKDLSVNFIPVPYPTYPPAIIKTKPLQRELWRVLNASADTFLDLHLLTKGKWQSFGLVSLDGVPLGYEETGVSNSIQWTPNIPLPPGGRAEFFFDSPADGVHAQLLTAGVDTVPSVDENDLATAAAVGNNVLTRDDDDNTPPRWLVTIESATDAPEPTPVLPKASSRLGRNASPPLLSLRSNRQRKLYFSEGVLDPKNPRASTIFYLTEEGRRPSAFSPAAAPNITVRQGDVEDWLIENRSQEAHTFHIHQIHFIVLERENHAVRENYLRDTVALPYWDGVSPHYPSVKLRMDFRNPMIVGTFPYHCHILQHEDGGMMGTVRVLKRISKN